MPRSDRGQGSLKFLVTLAILAALVFAGVKVVPVYVDNYQLADFVNDRALHAAVERTEAGVVQDQVVRYAQGLDLPVTRANVRVSSVESTVKIEVDYTVPVDLKVYTMNLRFNPSAESRAY